jgi:hypothetical protein
MSLLDNVAAIASIAGLAVSVYAAVQARSASRAANAARDAVIVDALADELALSCIRAEQLLDYLKHARYLEAALRVEELLSVLSELPRRRNEYLTVGMQNILLNARHQLRSVVDVTDRRDAATVDQAQVVEATRSVVMSLRGVLGVVRSQIALGEGK